MSTVAFGRDETRSSQGKWGRGFTQGRGLAKTLVNVSNHLRGPEILTRPHLMARTLGQTIPLSGLVGSIRGIMIDYQVGRFGGAGDNIEKLTGRRPMSVGEFARKHSALLNGDN